MKRAIYLYFIVTLSLLIGCRQPAPVSQNTVTFDTSSRREPISKYIYGQFIEHLGRCIYGGIWAEMLEDRKFYYPVSSEYAPWGVAKDDFWNAGEFRILIASPWKQTGYPGCLTMDSTKVFTGIHTPRITLPDNTVSAGIEQEGLLLTAGRKYEGRLQLAASSPDLMIRIKISSGDKSWQVAELGELSPDFTTRGFSFSIPESSENAIMEISGKGKGTFWIGSVSLMPEDNVQGFNKSVLVLMKQLNAPVYRWPGGNFVSGYNWRDGIGIRDKRPPRKNPAWSGIEPNDVGIHEFMTLCDLLNTEPYISVNTGLGTLNEVTDEVEYCNGPVSSSMGRLRAENGHKEPFNVHFWAVGNEMYGDWQLGHMPLEAYVKKHNEIAEAMYHVDPSIWLVAVGNAGQWSETMLKHCGDQMNLISEHIYCKELKDVPDHVRQIPDNIHRVAEVHRTYRDSIVGLTDKNIRIAMDEWNYWHGDYLYGELGCRYYLKDALGIAAGFHEYYRNSDLFYMANYAQTVNVIGAIKTTRKDAGFAATGVVLRLYRNHFGKIPINLEGIPETLDVSAALDEDGKALVISVVNAYDTVQNFNLKPKGPENLEVETAWEISNPDPMAYNVPGEANPVDIKEIEVPFAGYLEVKPYSITMVRYKLLVRHN